MADRAPERRFAGDEQRIGGDLQLVQAQGLQMTLPVGCGRKNLRLMFLEFADGRKRQTALFHIIERSLVDHIERCAATEPRQEREPRFGGASAKRREVRGADLRGVTTLAGMARAGVVDRAIGGAKTGL